MRFLTFLLGMVLITLVSLGSFIALIFYFNPFEASKFILILVYLTLFFSLTGLLSLISFFLRRILKSKSQNPVFKDINNSFWQGILLALILVIALIILSSRGQTP